MYDDILLKILVIDQNIIISFKSKINSFFQREK